MSVEESRDADGHCVLCIIPHRRWGGLAVVNHRGLVPKTLRTVNLQHKTGADGQTAALTRLVARAVKRYRPDVIVVGRTKRVSAPCVLRDAAITAARAAGVVVAERWTEEARRQLLGRHRRAKGDTLALNLAGIFPQLHDEIARGIDHFRYRRHAWNAAALAVCELVRIAPRSCTWLDAVDQDAVARVRAVPREALSTSQPPKNLPVEPAQL